MFTGKFFLSVIVITIAITFIQWFFTGFLFHKYQSLTPSTLRRESSRSYAGSMFLSLFFALMFAVIFSLYKSKYRSMNFLDGIEFGILCWLTFAIPYKFGTANYVNYSRMFVAGRCLSSVIEYIVAGTVAAYLL